MNNLLNQNKSKEFILYNNILSLSRNKLFYTKFALTDTFQNRINLIFFHISFIFVKINQNKKKTVYKNFYQKLFDLLIYQIELNMRELGYGDVTVNKNMKILLNNFYDILISCESYAKLDLIKKKSLLLKYFFPSKTKQEYNLTSLVHYFDKYSNFCYDLSIDDILKAEINFNY